MSETRSRAGNDAPFRIDCAKAKADFEPLDVSPRTRLERMTAARVRVETATRELEDALRDVEATRIAHPILTELREAVLLGKRILARSTEILKRIPV